MAKNGKNRRVTRISIAAVLGLVAVLLAAVPASAHRLGADSVDGREIRYVNHSRFDDEIRFGVGQWNKLDLINIRRSGSGTDLEFRDYNKCKDATIGVWNTAPNPDTISFNECKMREADENDRRGTAVHELGHALGLAHPGPAKRWCEDSIMYGTICKNSPSTPQRHDKQDYRELWGGGNNRQAERQDSGPSELKPRYVFDVEDRRKLVGNSTNVFVGRVVEEAGSEGTPLSGPGGKVLPRTQLSVEVLRNVKGDLDGTVTVDLLGGYDEEGREARVEGDSATEPGQKYVFVTNYDEEKGRYTVVAQPTGKVPVADDRQRGELEEEFEQAEQEQIIEEPPTD